MLTLDKIAKTIAGPNDATHIGEAKLAELQDLVWGRLKSQEQLHLMRSARYLMELFEAEAWSLAFVVANAAGDRFRCMGEFADGAGDFVDWTSDIDKALTFARRADAEAFARDDEDAWKIYRIADVPGLFSEAHKRPVGAVPAPAPTLAAPGPEKRATEGLCLPVDRSEPQEVLRIFRQFVLLNATQWQAGAGVPGHPMWGWLAEHIDSEENKSGPDWAFIQPENRKRHSVLTDEYLDLINSQEAEERGG